MQINATQIGRIEGTSTPLSSNVGPIDGDLFSSILKESANSALNVLKNSEKTAISGLTGGSSVTDTVHSVMAAERSFHTILAIRDKAISAYQEISRLQI